jgi:hypothetical protein
VARFLDELLAADLWVAYKDNGNFAAVHNPRQPPPTIRVVADSVSALYWQAERALFDWRTDFGPLRLPYPEVWIEGRLPRRIFADGVWKESGGGMLAALCSSTDDGCTIICEPYMKVPGQYPMLYPLDVEVVVDHDGHFVDHAHLIPEGFPVDAHPELVGMSSNIAKFVLLTVSLMNCRNVGLQDVEPPLALSKKYRKATGRSLLRYSRVVLPSLGTTRAEQRTAAGSAKPLHLVRGHFKTYDADAPLFGKHTGTWWWNWRAQGDPAIGTVVPRYEVGDRASRASGIDWARETPFL